MSIILSSLLFSCLLLESSKIEFANTDCIDSGCSQIDDVDGDGFGVSDGDCDDENAAVYPGAQEVCDGLDNNCDDMVDLSVGADGDLVLGYFDEDSDGFGTEPIYGCSNSLNWSLMGGDCNPMDPSVHPNAVEMCDEVDNDCDELIDDNDSDLVAPVKYIDADGDGFGGAQQVTQCSDEGVVSISGDCNDDDESISPSVEEDPYDLIDQNCDGIDLADSEDCERDLQGLLVECSEIVDIAGRPMSFKRIEAQSSPILDYAVTYPFAIMNFEVTNQQVRSLQFPETSANSLNLAPVDSISWTSAATVANFLTSRVNQQLGLQLSNCYENDGGVVVSVDPMECTGYRLPTTAEWEIASRAGTTLDFALDGSVPEGDDIDISNAEACVGPDTTFSNTSFTLGQFLWYCGNSQLSARVGSLLPNGYGLYDMQGNVAEWMHDVGGNSAIFSLSGEDPWFSAEIPVMALVRGGAFNMTPMYLSNNFQRYDVRAVSSEYNWLGLRLVRRLPY